MQAEFSSAPPYYNRTTETYYDEGQGIPVMTNNNITQQDVFRTSFLLTQNHHRNTDALVRDAEKSISQQSPLSKIFFSDKNMNRIQKKIKEDILERTKGQYKLDDDQDEHDLLIAMTAIFRTKARHLPENPIKQIKRLNTEVVQFVVPDMVTNIKQYYGYLKDINEPIKPIERPMNVSNAGRLTLPSVDTMWNG